MSEYQYARYQPCQVNECDKRGEYVIRRDAINGDRVCLDCLVEEIGAVPIRELEELAGQWEVQEEDPGKTQAAQAQLSICARELRQLIEDHE